jgi:hypothetical protein
MCIIHVWVKESYCIPVTSNLLSKKEINWISKKKLLGKQYCCVYNTRSVYFPLPHKASFRFLFPWKPLMEYVSFICNCFFLICKIIK